MKEAAKNVAPRARVLKPEISGIFVAKPNNTTETINKTNDNVYLQNLQNLFVGQSHYDC